MSKKTINDLLLVMQQLRDPENGCVWDKQQTYTSILPHTIEEVYEVAEAIETENYSELTSELGDLLFQIVFYSQIAKEEGRFEFDDVITGITEKMIRRHPHVFAGQKVSSVEEQSKLWDEIKKSERKEENSFNEQESALAKVNKYQPPLNVAFELQKKAAKVGFDWQSLEGPIDKVEEEMLEVKEAIKNGNRNAIKDEIGDLFFAVVNLSRHLSINPDEAIRSTNRKFENRFAQMELLAKRDELVFSSLTLEDQEQYWLKVKQQESE